MPDAIMPSALPVLDPIPTAMPMHAAAIVVAVELNRE